MQVGWAGGQPALLLPQRCSRLCAEQKTHGQAGSRQGCPAAAHLLAGQQQPLVRVMHGLWSLAQLPRPPQTLLFPIVDIRLLHWCSLNGAGGRAGAVGRSASRQEGSKGGGSPGNQRASVRCEAVGREQRWSKQGSSVGGRQSRLRVRRWQRRGLTGR